MRALAHPVRLRIMSLLTGASLTAAEVARALGISHANASYHLRNLLSGGLIVAAGEEKIRGGLAKRYSYDPASPGRPSTPEWSRLFGPAAGEPTRPAALGHRPGGAGVLAGAEIWVDPATWRDVRDRIAAAVHDLHAAARPPGSPGTIRTSTTVALFEMGHGFHNAPGALGQLPGAGFPDVRHAGDEPPGAGFHRAPRPGGEAAGPGVHRAPRPGGEAAGPGFHRAPRPGGKAADPGSHHAPRPGGVPFEAESHHVARPERQPE
ncbi:hypothetical protein Ate01nite_69790 [Actinoplanes teichomyceticus]|nr:hypothetical protein Ate01nite_69790 [Actinoplanes teichomyceticus]